MRYGKVWLRQAAIIIALGLVLTGGGVVLAQFHDLWQTERYLEDR